MALQAPADHAIITAAFSVADAEASDILLRINLELAQLMKQAKSEGRIIITHTVTLFEKLESVVLTLHTVKA